MIMSQGRDSLYLASRYLNRMQIGLTFPHADPGPKPPSHPLHHLWAQLEPAQISEARFQPFRTAYREEVRRLRVWAATFLGEALLPAVAETHFFSCNALPNVGDRHVR